MTEDQVIIKLYMLFAEDRRSLHIFYFIKQVLKENAIATKTQRHQGSPRAYLSMTYS